MKKVIISFTNGTKEIVNVSSNERASTISKRNKAFDENKELLLKDYKKKYLKKFRALQNDILMGMAEELSSEEIAWYREISVLNRYDNLPDVPDRINNMED